MPHCCVPGCKSGYKYNKNKKKVSFHVFPANLNISKSWCNAINRNDFIPVQSSRICSLHFTDSCYELKSNDLSRYRKRNSTSLRRKYLKSNAMPTLLLGKNGNKRSLNALSSSRLVNEEVHLQNQIRQLSLQNKLLKVKNV